MSKVDQSSLRIHEVPPLQKVKSQVILQYTKGVLGEIRQGTVQFSQLGYKAAQAQKILKLFT